MTFSPAEGKPSGVPARIAVGEVAKHLFGRNVDVDTSLEDIWTQGGIYAWPTAASTLEVISDNAGDTSAGAGARTITIEGLDATFNEITEDVATNGTAASSPTVNSFVRVNRAFVKEAGAYSSTTAGGNLGNVTIRISGGGAVQAVIPFDGTGIGKDMAARYTVPAGKNGYLTSFSVNVDSSKEVRILLFKREDADVVAAPFASRILVLEVDGITGFEPFRPSVPIGPFPPKTDLWWAAVGSGVNIPVGVDFELVLTPAD